MFNKINSSKKTFALSVVVIFAIMLILNFWTDYCADDYVYHFNFYTGEKITGLITLAQSLYKHYFALNGRLAPHLLVQIFMQMPKFVFNFINAAVFTGLLLLIERLYSNGKKKNTLLLLALFSAIWVFQPAFGQINLWLDGSCNYLWSVFFATMYLTVHIRNFEGKDLLNSLPKKIFFLVFSLYVGGYSENTCAAMIGTSFLLMLLTKFYKKRKVSIWYIIGWLLSVAGYIFMAMSPAGARNKLVTDLAMILKRFGEVNTKLLTIAPIWILWLVLMIVSLLTKRDKDRIILSSLFMICSLAASYIMVMSTYFADRSMASITVFMIIADFILLSEMTLPKIGNIAVCTASLALSLYTLIPGYFGVMSIHRLHIYMTENIETVEAAAEAGESEVYIPMIRSTSKYTALNGLGYLIEDPTDFPNYRFGRYYGGIYIYPNGEIIELE